MGWSEVVSYFFDKPKSSKTVCFTGFGHEVDDDKDICLGVGNGFRDTTDNEIGDEAGVEIPGADDNGVCF